MEVSSGESRTSTRVHKPWIWRAGPRARRRPERSGTAIAQQVGVNRVSQPMNASKSKCLPESSGTYGGPRATLSMIGMSRRPGLFLAVLGGSVGSPSPSRQGVACDGALAVSTGGALLDAANAETGTVSAVKAASRKLVATVAAGQSKTSGLTDDEISDRVH